MSAEVRTACLGFKVPGTNVITALRIRFRLAQEDLDAYRQRGGWHRTRDLRHHQQTSWSVAFYSFSTPWADRAKQGDMNTYLTELQ